MIEFAINLEQEIEESSTECNLESVMKAIVEQQGSINNLMGPARFKLLISTVKVLMARRREASQE